MITNIKNLKDMLELSTDEFDRMLVDLKNLHVKFTGMQQVAVCVGGKLDTPESFIWLDDGKTDTTIRLGVKK